MIYKYTDKRAHKLNKLMKSIPLRKQDKMIIFAYGQTAFKFIYGNRTFEVSRYDEEIIIRKIQTKLV